MVNYPGVNWVDGQYPFTRDGLPVMEQGIRDAHAYGGVAVDNLSALRDLGTTFTSGATRTLLGLSVTGDGGAGTLYWDAAHTGTDDGVNVVKPTLLGAGSPGRWIRAPIRPTTSTALAVDTIAALKATDVTLLGNGESRFVHGYWAKGDGGGGWFRYNSSSTVADNGGTVIAPNTGSGRWERSIYEGFTNVKWFGAKGDSFTNDTAAIKQAILYSDAPGRGGMLFFPTGIYFFTEQLTTYYTTFIGEGMVYSVLRCTALLGAGVPALIMGLGGQGQRLTGLRDIAIRGPGTRSLGNKTASCDGVKLLSQMTLKDFEVSFFDTGVIVDSVGEGHIEFFGPNVHDNYYGVYFTSGGGPGGNYLFLGGGVNGNTFANYALSEAGTIVGSRFFNTHTGYAPYSFYQEAGSTDAQFFLDVAMETLSFEQCGNAAIFTEKYAGGSARGGCSGLSIENPGFTWNSAYKITARDNAYAVRLGRCNRSNKIKTGSWPFYNGSTGTLYIAANDGHFEYDDTSYGYIGPFPVITIAGGSDYYFRYRGPDLQGSDQINATTTSKVVTLPGYGGPVASLRPKITATSNGGLTNPALYVTDITSNVATGATTFTVRVPTAPSSNLTFMWEL